MNAQTKTDFIYSFKCAICSFAATYVSGVMHPFDLIKTRFQSHDGKSNSQNLVPKYSSVLGAVKQIYRSQGIRGLYKGFYISILSQALSISFFFWIYENRKKHYEKKNKQLMTAVTYSSIQASIIATFITQPFWVIKTRMLLNTKPGITQIQNFIQKTKQIFIQSGINGFNKGLMLSLILSFSGVIQMYIYQGSKMLYEYAQLPQTQLSQKTFICGALSKIFGVMLTYPITTVRTRIQQNQYFNNRNDAKYNSGSQVCKKMFKEQGIKGFYKGLSANLVRGVPQKGIYFYSYEIFKSILLTQKQKNN